ncbi:MAG: site-specific integrase [Clostridiales bacterium]|nr:site-specific integrase [Clostridiales bacterium]
MSKNTSTSDKRRIKGDGSVYYNEAKKLYVAQINSVDDETGKRIRKSVTGKTKPEAVQKMRALLSGKAEAPKPKQAVPEPKKRTHKLYDFMMEYLIVFKMPTVTSRTFEWYRNISYHIRDGLGQAVIEDLTAIDIQKFLNPLSLKNSDKTIKGIQGLLNQVLRHAVKLKIIPSNPFDDGVKRPKSQKAAQKRKALPRHVCRDILQALDKYPTYKPLVMVLLYSGIRVGELMALRWRNIDEDNMLLYIENAVTTKCEFDENGKTIGRKQIISNTKTAASERVIPLELEILEVLKEWRIKSEKTQAKARNQGNEDLIFPNQYGGIRSYSGFKKQFQRFLSENGLDGYGITFHKFRHTFATLLMEQGANPRVVQELLGHRDIETTLGIYTTVSMGIKEKETGRLAAELKSIRSMTGTDQRHNLIVAHGLK